jgi:hypothetical protein
MADVFISYKREDRPMAERLSIALEQLGFDVWWDFELLSGQRYRRVIEQVIDKCSAAIVPWSALARESEFVLDEAAYAKEQGKLCPARIDDCRLPLGFGNVHTDDLQNWSGELSHPGLARLLSALEEKTGKKARLGARPRGPLDEARARDLESYKAAQLSGTADALRAYLRMQPNGMFAEFVQHQLAEVRDREAVTPAATFADGIPAGELVAARSTNPEPRVANRSIAAGAAPIPKAITERSPETQASTDVPRPSEPRPEPKTAVAKRGMPAAGFVVVAVVVIGLLGSWLFNDLVFGPDDAAYRTALEGNRGYGERAARISGFEAYLLNYPEGRHTREAAEHIRHLREDEARDRARNR